MPCPYSPRELDQLDGVYTPVGQSCYDCPDWECEHNANPKEIVGLEPKEAELFQEVHRE